MFTLNQLTPHLIGTSYTGERIWMFQISPFIVCSIGIDLNEAVPCSSGNRSSILRFDSQKNTTKQVGWGRIVSSHLCNSKTGHPVIVACQYTWKKRQFNLNTFGLTFVSAENICCDCKLCLGLGHSSVHLFAEGKNFQLCWVFFDIFFRQKVCRVIKQKSSTCSLSPHAVPYIAVEVIISCARGSGVKQMIEEIKILSLDYPGFWAVIDHVSYC